MKQLYVYYWMIYDIIFLMAHKMRCDLINLLFFENLVPMYNVEYYDLNA